MEAENRDDEVPADGGDAPDTEDGGGDADAPDVEDDGGDADAPVAEDDADVPSFFRLTKKTGRITDHFQVGPYRYVICNLGCGVFFSIFENILHKIPFRGHSIALGQGVKSTVKFSFFRE